MSQTAEHDGELSLPKLQRSLQIAEAGLKKLTAIEVVPGTPPTITMSTHTGDPATRVLPRSLVLVEDNDQGTVTAPAGTQPEPVCRGEALIGGSKKKVAAFRKKPAA